MKRLYAILLVCFFSSIQAFSQSFNFDHYSINEGLSQSVVNCVFQDSKGFIWLGTQNGLNRFNGETFDIYIYNPFDSSTISNNWIYSIAEDKEGNLWIGTKGGLNKYLPAANNFERIQYVTGFEHDVTQYFYDVVCLNSGQIAINTPPVVSIFNPEDGRFNHFQSKLEYDGFVKDVKIPVIEDNNGFLWVGSTKGLARFSFESKEFDYIGFSYNSGKINEEANVTALFMDKKERLWAGTTEGLFEFHSETNQFQESVFNVDGENLTFTNTCIRTITEDKTGNLLVGSEGRGLFVISVNKGGNAGIRNFTTENSQIGHNIVQSLIIDNSDNLWIGNLQGVSKSDLKRKKFDIYRKDDSPNSIDLLGNVIASLYKNDDGKIWVGNWGQGLNLVNRSTGEVEHFSTVEKGNHNISNDFIHVIFKDSEGNIWIGTRNGILIYERQSNRFVPYFEYFQKPDFPKLENTRIYKIIQDKKSNFWVGTQNGLYRFNLKIPEYETYRSEYENDNHISANLVYSVLEDSEGLIWIATVNGLDVFNPENRKFIRYDEKSGLSDDFIITLCEDRLGKIWIGTSTYINVFNKKDSSFTWYAAEQGLPNNRIFEIVKDKNDVIWVTTGKGLCRFNDVERYFQTFTPEDGLQSLEFNIRAACACDDGELLFGGMNGFNAFYPDSIGRNSYVPNVEFTSLYSIKGKNREFFNNHNLQEIKVPYNISSLTIEFAALEFTNPRKNRYKYQMLGISEDWIDIGNRRFVPFSGLQPGEYVFNVKGSNNDGVWNNTPASLKILVLPPWYRSVYAYIFYLFLLFASILTFIKLRERKLVRDKKNLEQKVHERTLRIEKQNQMIVSKNAELEELNYTKDKLFSIIGHDLGNQFNIILGFLDVLVSNFKKLDQAKVETHLHNINNSSKQAYNLLENLLTWARMQTNQIQFNPEKLEVKTKITDSVKLFEGACARKSIRIEVKDFEEIMVVADENMFSTVFRNIVSNAVKFTPENGSIIIFAERKNGYCKITIQDNGVGISKEDLTKIFKIGSKHRTRGTQGEKGTGLGLVLCKEFVEKQGGYLTVKSKEGKGSQFSFTLPLAKSHDPLSV